MLFIFQRFSTYYQDGVDKYEQKQWKESIELLEIAMDTWLQEHDKCRAFCESEFDQGWFPDFTASVASEQFSRGSSLCIRIMSA